MDGWTFRGWPFASVEAWNSPLNTAPSLKPTLVQHLLLFRAAVYCSQRKMRVTLPTSDAENNELFNIMTNWSTGAWIRIYYYHGGVSGKWLPDVIMIRLYCSINNLYRKIYTVTIIKEISIIICGLIKKLPKHLATRFYQGKCLSILSDRANMI